MNPILSFMWESYRRRCVPPDSDAVQVAETMQAFYGGAWAILCRLGDTDGAQMDNDATSYFDELREECRIHLSGRTQM